MEVYDTIHIPSAAPRFTGELYKPAASKPAGLVVLVYGTDGFVDNPRGPWKTMIRGYAKELASKGMYALIPKYFAATGTPDGGPAADLIAAHRDTWATALVDTVAMARTLPGVDASRIGMVGFSLGGYLCLKVRAAAKPKALSVYFPPVFDGIGPSGSVPFAEIHHGTKDKPPTGFENAAVIAKALRLEGTDVTVAQYKDATHGFAGSTEADKKAAAASQAATVKFLETRLK